MNQPAKVWPLLQRQPNPDDPRVRSYLIHRWGPLGAAASALVQRLADEPDVTIRRALVLSLGPEEFPEGTWRPEEKQRLVGQLQGMYRTDSDPGLHAAAEWLLRQWQQGPWLRQTNEEWVKNSEQRAKRLKRIRQALAKAKEKTPPQWYVNSQGQTMVVIPGPGEFVMGSPSTEEGRQPNELQHTKKIGRTFALAAQAVTVEQYRKFNARYGKGEIEQWARTADSPVLATDWFQAVSYCNWLSQQEGMKEEQWCYPKEIKPGIALPRDYLSRSGYRLPTEAELEYATRAGAATSRYYGETEEQLEKYARYQKNGQEQAWPVGGKKPNDLGLFDVHGNVWNWCQDRYENYPAGQGGKAYDDKEGALTINIQDSRVMRGGSFTNQAVIVRSATRSGNVPSTRFNIFGFRPARTFTAE
jgi:formylglycine-generating enzyme required for sulfatase activity